MNNSFISDKINVHFVHRGLAYILLVVLIIWFVKARTIAGQSKTVLFTKIMWWPFLLVLLQVTLGIITVLSAPVIVPGKFGEFEVFAELHQLVAMFLLMSLVVNLYVVGKRR